MCCLGFVPVAVPGVGEVGLESFAGTPESAEEVLDCCPAGADADVDADAEAAETTRADGAAGCGDCELYKGRGRAASSSSCDEEA